MKARWSVALLWTSVLLACGRVGFDPRAAPDAASDAAMDTGMDAADAMTDEGAPDAAVVRAGLVLELSFDVSPTADGSGGGHDARCVGSCPTLDPAGVFGSALSVGAGDEHLRVDDDGSFDLSAGFTAAAWARHDRDRGRTCVFAKPISGTTDDSFALCADGDAPFAYLCGGCQLLRSGINVGFGVWYHAAVTHDGSMQRYYIDGVEVGTRSGSVDFDASPLLIGGDEDSGAFGYALEGRIDEVRLYDRPLSAVEIASLATP